MREERKDDGYFCTSDSDGTINMFTCRSRATVN